MLVEHLTVDQTIDFLNELLRVDPEAIHALIETRVPCNDSLADHPTVQVTSATAMGRGKGWQVGLLGILNGLFGIIEHGSREANGYITAVYNDEDMLVGFERTKEE